MFKNKDKAAYCTLCTLFMPLLFAACIFNFLLLFLFAFGFISFHGSVQILLSKLFCRLSYISYCLFQHMSIYVIIIYYVVRYLNTYKKYHDLLNNKAETEVMAFLQDEPVLLALAKVINHMLLFTWNMTELSEKRSNKRKRERNLGR